MSTYERAHGGTWSGPHVRSGHWDLTGAEEVDAWNSSAAFLTARARNSHMTSPFISWLLEVDECQSVLINILQNGSKHEVRLRRLLGTRASFFCFQFRFEESRTIRRPVRLRPADAFGRRRVQGMENAWENKNAVVSNAARRLVSVDLKPPLLLFGRSE